MQIYTPRSFGFYMTVPRKIGHTSPYTVYTANQDQILVSWTDEKCKSENCILSAAQLWSSHYGVSILINLRLWTTKCMNFCRKRMAKYEKDQQGHKAQGHAEWISTILTVISLLLIAFLYHDLSNSIQSWRKSFSISWSTGYGCDGHIAMSLVLNWQNRCMLSANNLYTAYELQWASGLSMLYFC